MPLETVGVIQHLSDVPRGQLHQEGLPPEWRERFAVLLDSSHALAHVLTCETAMGTAAMYELRRRLLALPGLANVRFMRASREIIKLTHQRAEPATTTGFDQHDATSTEQFAHDLIEQALMRSASDIHIETRTDHAAVYLRINGRRQLLSNIAFESARALGVVLYSVHADASSKDVTWDPQQVMDGAIEHRTTHGLHVQLRFSSAPIFPSGNFHIVVRLLMMSTTDRQIDDLGYTPEQMATLEAITSDLSGMVVLCGPTNSGKSTTLQALMKRMHSRLGETIKMITVEDPVEYVIPGACQIGISRKRKTSVDERTGSAFTTFLRGTLRQDPDVVMVGEIRDLDSAAVVKDLVLAGRKLLTTLHTYSATWAFVRLRELGVPPELLTMPGFISGIVYQRLVPVLCPHCSLPLHSPQGQARLPEGTLTRALAVCHEGEHPARVRGPGCAECGHSGISGRTLCAEMVIPDRHMLGLIAQQRFLEAEQYWHERGHLDVDGLGVDALAHGIQKLRAGWVDPQDLESNVGLLRPLVASAS
ncbi:GspE/PulE family protein [Comamonas composti]|uniref:GspE/PulE family protein n=1 Tax=Comamonas composti TaxID=408558 RepID=UPI000687776A|nr:ATPase, T2SS/T4P/T4SS family [Comamonas composti]